MRAIEIFVRRPVIAVVVNLALVLIGLVTTWFAGYVVYKLFQSQR